MQSEECIQINIDWHNVHCSTLLCNRYHRSMKAFEKIKLSIPKLSQMQQLRQLNYLHFWESYINLTDMFVFVSRLVKDF